MPNDIAAGQLVRFRGLTAVMRVVSVGDGRAMCSLRDGSHDSFAVGDLETLTMSIVKVEMGARDPDEFTRRLVEHFNAWRRASPGAV